MEEGAANGSLMTEVTFLIGLENNKFNSSFF